MGARVCVRACVHDVFAIYDNNILPRLIMIIIKIISRFIEIAHTDDFPLMGTRLVKYKSITGSVICRMQVPAPPKEYFQCILLVVLFIEYTLCLGPSLCKNRSLVNGD